MSIRIYTNFIKFNKEFVLLDNNKHFYYSVSMPEIDELGQKVMWEIDRARIVDVLADKIETPRGICSITELSAGCKTVLNYLYAIDNYKAINISQCGINALEMLFDVAELKQKDVGFILLHKDNISKCSERDYIINDEKHIKNLLYM